MTPDLVKYTLGGFAVVALGIVGKAVVERVARWGMDWLARVNAGLDLLTEMKATIDGWVKRVEGWDVHGLRGHVNVIGLRQRVTEARVHRNESDITLIRAALERHAINVEPAPQLDMRLRAEDRETVEILLRLLREQVEE